MALTASCHGSCRAVTCPPWLQAALADVEQRVQSLANTLPEDSTSDSFAERAENYYEKRPQLLSLIQDLHNRYLYLADRYSQSLLKLNTSATTLSTSSSAHHSELSDDDDRPPLSSISTFSDPDPDVISSFHFPSLEHHAPPSSLDTLVTELTMSLVERNILADELSHCDHRMSDSLRKIDLQKSLLEVMESERMVLVAENERLEYRATVAEEEGRGLAAEVGFLRRKAAELAKCLARMREGDHRVCVLGRRIEALQRQVHGMRWREREWREAMGRREREKGEVREEVERLREENRRLRRGRARRAWWRWVGACVGEQEGKGGGNRGGWKGCFWDNPCFCL